MNFLTCSEKIEKILEKYFQKNVSICIKDEVLKKGKFLLVRNHIINNNYYYELIIERSKKLDVVKIPYPFRIEEYEEDNILYLDYRISSILIEQENKKQFEKWLKDTDIKISNKFFDNILEIKFE